MLGLLHRSPSADASILKSKSTEALTNGSSNGHSVHLKPENGLTSPRTRPSAMRTVSSVSVNKKLTKQIITSSQYNVRGVNAHIKEQYTAVRRECQRKLGSHAGSFAYDTSYEGLLDWIRSERLIRVPHKGGHWDRVLVEVQHFAQQVYHLTMSMGVVSDDSIAASHLIFGHCLLLLELGHENAAALERSFHLFYQFGLELVPILRCQELDLYMTTPEISESIGNVFSSLLNIVTAVAGTFWTAVHGGRESTIIDIYKVFDVEIDAYYSHVTKTAHAIWCVELPDDDETDIMKLERLQKRLSPQDGVLTFLAGRHMNIAARPEQFTCTWFQSHLNEFMRGEKRILRVEGKTGSGKTTLANWTLDRLQRPINRKQVTTISFFANSTIAGQNSGLALVRTLLYQLLYQRIGDECLFNEINKVVTPELLRRSVQEQEDELWKALNEGLRHLEADSDTLVIIIDGINGIGEKSVTQKISQRLWNLTRNVPVIRLIQFSECIDMAATKEVKHFELTAEVLRQDMGSIARRSLLKHIHFTDLKEQEQDKIIDLLVSAAGTSILSLTLACRFLRKQQQISSKSLELIIHGSNIASVPDLVHKILSLSTLSQDSKDVIKYILTAERPLLFSEIKLLLEDSQVPRSLNLEEILMPLGPFVLISEGLVAIRHKLVMNGFLMDSSPAKWLLNHQQRQKDLLMKMLVYASQRFHEECQPTPDPLESHQVHVKIHGHSLLEYTVRYWIRHFERTSHYQVDGALVIPNEIKTIFPSSVMFALLEEDCWSTQVPARTAVDYHITAYRIREALYGQKQCVLQTAMTIAKINEVMLSDDECAVKWYHISMNISHKVLGLAAELTELLCRTVLRITEKYMHLKRNEMMVWRHNAYKLLLEIYKFRFGSSHRHYIEIWELYMAFLIHIGEKPDPGCFPPPGPRHHDVHAGIEGTVTLGGQIVVHQHKDKTEIDPLEADFLFGYVADGVHVTLTLEMYEKILILIAEHIKFQRIEQAEALYIELWLRLTEHCQSPKEVDWHERRIRIMIEYCRFLYIHKRTTEASSILLCIWREYEHHQCTSFEKINILLKDVAVLLLEHKVFATSLAILRKCWSWYRYAHKENTEIFREIETSITICAIEIVKTSSTSQMLVTIINEIFESTLSSYETISSITIELCRALTSIYMKEELYSKAIVCIESALRKSWTSFFFDSDVSIIITSKFHSANIELVQKLALCYLHQKRYEKVEEIYLRLYRVHRKSYSIDHKLVVEYTELILKFYKEYGFFNKAITFYQELLVEYRIHHGAAHTIVIQTLYALGDLCRQHHLTHGYWIEYYLEIVNVLNKGNAHCHEDALRALIIVAEHHYEALRYSEALVYFKSIFSTFIQSGLTYKYFEKTVEVQHLIEHYFRSIEESQIEIVHHITLIKTLRDACIKHYEKKSSIVVNVTLVLATVCRRSEKHEFDAIYLYEFILEHSTTVKKETLKEVKTSLRHLYYRLVMDSTTVTKEVIEKAVRLTYEEYTIIRKDSHVHEKTLTLLKELIHLWHKQSKSDLILKELRTIMIDIILTISRAEELVESGKFLAELYVYCGFEKHALEILHEIRQQVIYKVHRHDCLFKIIQCDRTSLSFVAAFEFYVRHNWKFTLAVLIGDFIAEYSYYQHFLQSLKGSSLQIIFEHGARLRRILMRTERMTDFVIVENKLIEYFVSHEKRVMEHCTQAAVKAFVVLVLKYCSNHIVSTTFTAAAGHAAIADIEILLKTSKTVEAVNLTKCTFYYLLAHEGIDDPTEIHMGIRLSLLMSGRRTKQKPTQAMLELSKTILREVFAICKKCHIDVARIQLSELNEVIEMIGEQKDYETLHWLLRELWSSRESQTKWPKEAILKLGKRLVQAEFAAGHYSSATRLCEDIAYNIRRVYGARHQSTLDMYELLATLYTSCGNKQKNRVDAEWYYKKSMAALVEGLKAFIGLDETDEDDDDDDSFSEYNGSVIRGSDCENFVNYKSKTAEIEAAIRYIKKLQLAMQRSGGWTKPVKEYERLCDGMWKSYGSHMKLKEEEVRCGQWKADKLADDVVYDCFVVPSRWGVITA